jgi:hypothetical protein
VWIVRAQQNPPRAVVPIVYSIRAMHNMGLSENNARATCFHSVSSATCVRGQRRRSQDLSIRRADTTKR